MDRFTCDIRPRASQIAIVLVFALSIVACSGSRSGTGFAPPSQQSVEEGSASVSIASIQIELPLSTLPLGQQMTFAVIAKNSSGGIIKGRYDHPIRLAGKYLTISPSTVSDSRAASHITAIWNEAGVAECDYRNLHNSRRRPAVTGSIIATVDGYRARAQLNPGTGFAFYAVGNNPNTDVYGFPMTLGPDGKLYYGTLGPTTCNSSLCYSTDGAVGQFDPSTAKWTEIELHSEGFGVGSTSDGGLWIGGGFVSHKIFHLPAGSFSASALESMTVPAPGPGVDYVPGRAFAEDGSGNVWFNDGSGHRVFKNPIAGPYDGSALTAYALPSGPSGTPQVPANGQGMAYGGDGNVYLADLDNGLLDRIAPTTGSTNAQILTPQQQAFGANGSAGVRYITKSGAGTLYLSVNQSPGGMFQGGVDSLVPGSTVIHEVTLPNAPSGKQPDAIGSYRSHVYYADPTSNSLGFINTATGKSRSYPLEDVQYGLSANFQRIPNGIAVLSDGTAWFTCYGGLTTQPLCLGHTVYLSGWSIFPGPDITIAGFGSASSQPVGIMESPSKDSGPFKVVSSKKSVCSVSSVRDHNFVITGVAAGVCTVTVTDASSVKATVQVTVVASTAPSRARLRRL